MQGWSRTFRLVKNTLETETYATQDELAAHKKSMKSSREYKTPHKKSKGEGFDNTPLEAYSSLVPGSEESSTEQAEKFMSHIEKYFLFMHK